MYVGIDIVIAIDIDIDIQENVSTVEHFAPDPHSLPPSLARSLDLAAGVSNGGS